MWPTEHFVADAVNRSGFTGDCGLSRVWWSQWSVPGRFATTENSRREAVRCGLAMSGIGGAPAYDRPSRSASSVSNDLLDMREELGACPCCNHLPFASEHDGSIIGEIEVAIPGLCKNHELVAGRLEQHLGPNAAIDDLVETNPGCL